MLNKHELLNAPARQGNAADLRKQQQYDANMERLENSYTITGGQFAQHNNDDIVTGDDGRTVLRVTCFKCNRKGHYSDHCSDEANGDGQGGGDNTNM